MYQRIGFIGCGNMGGALARCAAKGIGRTSCGELFLADAISEKAESLAAAISGTICTNETLAKNCDLLFLAVKPQMLEDLMKEISHCLAERTDRFVMVSMVAGVEMGRIHELAGGEYPVIRIMPNTAAAVGAGMIQFCTSGVTDEETEAFLNLMKDAGEFDAIPEKLIDPASAVSGCGPAYLCLALEGMADGGVSLGLPRDKAIRYAAQTILGLGKLAMETGLHPGVLKDQVTSPGGTTIQGVRVLENYSVRAAFLEAVIASFEKTAELKKNT